jgi:carboxyl-terminal processing protease
LIVLLKKKGKYKKTYATKKGGFETGKVFVLQNENSAPRVKFWLVIQDNDRGLSGRRSFGKGLVQREMDFDDGSAVRLTVEDYTPTGRSTKPIKGMKNILMSQKSVLIVVNYMRKTACSG